MSVAPLKPPVIAITSRLVGQFPRLNERGSIEASQAVVQAFLMSRFPRLNERGSIEAAPALSQLIARIPVSTLE